MANAKMEKAFVKFSVFRENCKHLSNDFYFCNLTSKHCCFLNCEFVFDLDDVLDVINDIDFSSLVLNIVREKL